MIKMAESKTSFTNSCSTPEKSIKQETDGNNIAFMEGSISTDFHGIWVVFGMGLALTLKRRV